MLAPLSGRSGFDAAGAVNAGGPRTSAAAPGSASAVRPGMAATVRSRSRCRACMRGASSGSSSGAAPRCSRRRPADEFSGLALS